MRDINEDVKQRYKVMPGFKSFESANAFLSLRRIIYNFVRRNETRAMKADIALKLGQNRLLHLIKIWTRNIHSFWGTSENRYVDKSIFSRKTSILNFFW